LIDGLHQPTDPSIICHDDIAMTKTTGQMEGVTTNQQNTRTKRDWVIEDEDDATGISSDFNLFDDDLLLFNDSSVESGRMQYIHISHFKYS
jgi:hypothetical protein